MGLRLLRLTVVRAVLNETGKQSAATAVAHGGRSNAHFLPRCKCRFAGQCRCGGIVLPCFVAQPTWTGSASGPVPERCCSGEGVGAMRPFGAGSHPLRPCICRESWRGRGGLHFVSRRLGLLRRNRPARQISPTCGLPREANFSGLPVLHCVAAPSLRYGMRRAQTLTHRITPRPRWARPG
jgi:hypothetical protein